MVICLVAERVRVLMAKFTVPTTDALFVFDVVVVAVAAVFRL